MAKYLADTVAIVWHLRNHTALGHQAAQILGEADLGKHRIYLSAITLMEVLYLSQARRINVGLQGLIQHINNSTNYTIIPVNTNIVLAAVEIEDVPELHDRIIVATAHYLDVPMLTSDQVIAQSKHIKAIW